MTKSIVARMSLRILSAMAIMLMAGCAVLPNWPNQSQRTEEPFSGDRAFAHARYLSQDIGPRPASSESARKAAGYIAEQLRSQRLEVRRPSFEYQTYREKEVELEVIQPATERIKATSLSFSATGERTSEIANAAEGQPEDVAGIGVSGKIALIKRGGITFSAKVANAANAGAVGAIIYNNVDGDLRGNLDKPSQIPAVAISRQDGERLLAILEQGAVRVRLLMDAEMTTKESENVVGIRRGGSGQILILGAHYDSVEVSPGANDNGSGVGTVVELARVTSSKSYPFEVRFIAFGAEELGLIGSRRYVESLTREERERVVAVINFDMVGVGDDLKFGGMPDLVQEAKEIAKGLGIDAGDLAQKLSGASDHASFIDAGIPALMVYWQEDPNYHTKNDRAEFVKPDRLQVAGEIALGIMSKSSKVGMSGYLGSGPDHGAETEGVALVTQRSFEILLSLKRP